MASTATPTVSADLEKACINAIRGFSIDGVQKANSGHPGLPLGAAAFAYTLWTKHLRHNPANPHWFDRDRFILSAGHGSMLLYSLLFLTGYDLSLDDLKQFRQVHSRTPGHPENELTPGVEMATGPLGQGFATAVGFAIAESHFASTFNRPAHNVIDHFTYGICSDGDMMEGISSEAASLAGHLKLGKLIFLYDDNDVSLDGSTLHAFTEDVMARFYAYGWHTQHVDGFDVSAVDAAIESAKNETQKPSIIACKTVIGFGSPNKAGTSKAHGSPLGPDEVALTKKALGIPLEPAFYVDDAALAEYRKALPHGAELEQAWNARMDTYAASYPEEAALLRRMIGGEVGNGWLDKLPSFSEKLASRAASAQTINAIAPELPNFIGGSADLSESTLTMQKGFEEYQPESRQGRNIWFGVREHAMIAAVNGLTLHGGLKAYGGTFLVFSDYCRGSLRLAAIMRIPSIFVFTHDSIGVGEDGPTHEPVEHVMSLRAIPNMNVMRPCDGNETAACWKIALQSKHTPTLMALSRQGLQPLSPSDVKNHPAEKGAYILQDAENPVACIVATGSEIQLAVATKVALAAEGIVVRVVSMPSWLLFERQTAEYRASILPKSLPTVSVEAGTTLGWARYAQAHVGLDRFGLSGPGEKVMEELGFTVDHVAWTVKNLIGRA